MGERKKEKGEWRWLAHRPTTLKLRWINSLGVDGRKEKGEWRWLAHRPTTLKLRWINSLGGDGRKDSAND